MVLFYTYIHHYKLLTEMDWYEEPDQSYEWYI